MTTKAMTQKIENFISKFPDNATCWSQATDEIRDLARTAKEYYNEIDLDLLSEEVEEGQGQQPLNFRALKTPSEWNTQGKVYIREVWTLMSEQTKKQWFENWSHWFNQK